MHATKALALLLLATAMLACSSAATTQAPSSSSEASDPTDRDHVDRSGNALLAMQVALVGADSAFSFDPTIDPAATADQNAANVRTTASRPTCAAVSASGTPITVDWGAGCVVGAMTLAGRMSVSVAKTGSTTTLSVGFTNVSANGKSISGTASFATSDGTTFTVTLDLTSGGAAVSGTVTAVGRSGALQADGALTVKSGPATATVTIRALSYTRGRCYPDGGTITVESALGTTTYELTVVTPTNGQVQVTKDGVPKDVILLPAYGTCGAA